MIPRDVTLGDIARALELSIATVSRALRDHPHISARTKHRVRDAAERVGYVSNAAANTLHRARSSLVGFVVPDIENEFYATMASFVAARLAQRGCQMVLAITQDDPRIELDHVRAMREARAAAVAVTLTAAPLPETIRLLAQFPTVQVVRIADGLAGRTLVVDEEAAAMMAMRHLLDLGHRDIAYIGGSTQLSSGQHRLAGYVAALGKADIAVESKYVALGPPRASFARSAMMQFAKLSPRPTAVIASGYELTLGAAQCVCDLRIRVPQELSLIGYGNARWSELIFGGLTMIALPVEDMAFALAETLLGYAPTVDGSATSTVGLDHCASQFVPHLEVRNSTSPLGSSIGLSIGHETTHAKGPGRRTRSPKLVSPWT